MLAGSSCYFEACVTKEINKKEWPNEISAWYRKHNKNESLEILAMPSTSEVTYV